MGCSPIKVAVSYTHLDVYKRQVYTRAGAGRCELPVLPAVFYCDEGNLRIKEKSAQAARPHGKAFVKHLRHVHNKHTVSVPVAYGAVYT